MSQDETDGGQDAATRAATPHGFTALKSGTRLDNRYTIEAVLAAGGFGITYIARHDGLGRTFAIKEHFPRQFAYRDGTTSEVRPTDPGTFKWALDRFLLEGRALARCKHPNVVDVTDVFEANRTAYMVLVYEDGQSLKSWLDGLGRPPTQAEIDGVLAPLLDALAFVHSQDLLHRDIAPDNIMVRRDGTPCLIDFGAARQAIAQRSQVMSAIVKTGFSPPEQYTTTGRAQGPWSDIYALGATLYRAVTGKVPPEATDRLIGDELVPITAAVSDPAAYRPGFLAGIERALRLRQSERPQTVAEWRAMLFSDGWPETPAVRAPRATSERSATAAEPESVRAASFSSLAGARDAPAGDGRGWLRRPGVLAAAAGVIAVAAVAASIGVRPPAPPERRAATAPADAPAGQPAVIEPASRVGQGPATSVQTGEQLRAALKVNTTFSDPALTPEQKALLEKRKEMQDAAETERRAERAREDAAVSEAAAREAARRGAAEQEQRQLLERRARLQEEAEREQRVQRAASSGNDVTRVLGASASQVLAPLTEKDRLRVLRLFDSRQRSLARAMRNARDDRKSLAAIEAAQKLLSVPSVPAVPDQLIGRWRCRSISLGGSLGDGNPQFAADIGGNFECAIARDPRGLVFRKLTGSMKKLARLEPLKGEGAFLLYYGTTIAQSDPQPTYPGGDPYGHEVGLMAQLGPDRLRLELSEPNHSASAGHEVIELVRIR